MKKSALAEVSFDRARTEVRGTSVRAPQLQRVVDALFALEKDPQDKGAKVRLALLEKQGAASCPACGAAFRLRSYQCTKTPFSERATLACRGCGISYVVKDVQVV